MDRINEFGKKVRAQRKTTFIEQARQEEFYPHRGNSEDPIAEVEQAVYDVALEKINETANLGHMTRKQQELVFKLLKRSLENENLLEVLQEVAKLSHEDVLVQREMESGRSPLVSIARASVVRGSSGRRLQLVSR